MREITARAVAFILRNRVGFWLAIIGATLLFAAFEYAVARWLIAIHVRPVLHCLLHAVIVGSGAGLALWLILHGISERRRMEEAELCRVVELNHTLRNALEVIVLAHYSATDNEHKAMVLECTDRIDQKLRELFPVIGTTRIQMKNGKWEICGRKH